MRYAFRAHERVKRVVHNRAHLAKSLARVPCRTCARLLLLLALSFDLIPAAILAQRPALVRTYRAAGSYSAAVSFSPGGSVLSRSGDSAQVTVLDGFSRVDLEMPEETHFRVYQSRSGQLWSVAYDGLLLHHGGHWTQYPVPEIRNELRGNVRPLRQISLLPAEVNRVLILLPDRLAEFETTQGFRVLKFARETGLGQFSEMQEGSDESIWITGTFGVARVPGPLRRINADTEWTEHLISETNRVNNLQRPFEGPAGQITASANPLSSEARFIARLESSGWAFYPVAEERIRQAWRGWDGLPWAYTFNSLFRFDPAVSPSMLREPVFGRQYDVAVEPSGAFWIGTSDGLVRYAPPLWQTRVELERVQSAVHSLVFQPGGSNLWLSLPEGLLHTGGRQLQLFRWTEEIEALDPARARLFLLPDQRPLIATPEKPFIFSPETQRFTPFSSGGSTNNIHFLGQASDGSVIAWFESGTALDLRRFNGANFTPLELPQVKWDFGELVFFEETGEGEAWIGSTKGLLQVRPNGTAEVHGPAQGLPNERIFTIASAGDGRLWCGTESRVLEWRGQRWQPILTTSGRVLSILRAQGSMWVGAAGGIYRLLGDTWISYGPNEGLSTLPIFTLRRSPTDELWAGTARGVAAFHPEADRDPPRAETPVLLEPARPSTVEPTVITFAGRDKWDYTMATDLLFSYKLDEGPWSPFSNTVTRVFQNLSSGSHTLQVLAMDRNGNRSTSPAQITFSVFVPWFADPRLLFVTILALSVTLILAGLAVNKHLQLKRSYAEVEKIVAQRTRELERANRELLHSQKMRAIGTMAAGIAHDFNNILSIIKGSAQIIESNVTDRDKIKTRVDRIQTVVEQGTTIVNALLGLGRLKDKDLVPCDIAQLLHETRKLLADRFPDSVEIHIDAASGLPRTMCAQEVLQQMLLNLILNAVDALGGEGLIVLAVKAVSRLPTEMVLEPARSESYLVLSVIDEGSGIAPENLSRIFEPFFTTKAFSSRRGTGLGLSMVYELAKGFGYGLSVTTRPGEGSTFSILLPVIVTGKKKRGASTTRLRTRA